MTPPAAVVEACAKKLRFDFSFCPTDCEMIANVCLKAAAEAGWALVAKADIQECRERLSEYMSAGIYCPDCGADREHGMDCKDHCDLGAIASRLRSALGNGGGG